MVAHRAGGQLHAVAHQVVLEGGDGQGVHLPLDGLFDDFQAAVGHGEGVMAEFQLAGLLANLIHGEVHNPAELIPLLVNVAGAEGPQLAAQDASGLLGGQLCPGAEAHKAAGSEPKGLHHLVLDGLDKLGDAAHNLTVLVISEPVGLVARLDLHLIAQPVDLLPGAGEAGHHNGLDGLMRKGREAAAGQQGGGVGHGEVDAQVGLVGAVFFHGFQVGDADKGGF